MKLADLINNYPNRSRIKETFVRESRGNYKYGDKKLQIITEGTRFSSIIFINHFSKILE